MSCHPTSRDRTRARTLLVQEDVEALLGAVSLELRVGDELGGHGGGGEEVGGGGTVTEPGRDDWSDGRQMGVALYEQA